MRILHPFLALGLVLCSAPLPARTDVARVPVGGSLEPVPAIQSRGELARATGILRAQQAWVASAGGQLALARLAQKTLAAGGPGGGGIVTFDALNAPCGFSNTQPVNGLVEGVEIRGRFPNGGAILDTCSNFGVAPLSLPNFLAFNSTVGYGQGGSAVLPEVFLFGGAYSSVTVPLSGGYESGYPVSIVAFGRAGIVDSVDLITGPDWTTHTLGGTGITGIAVLGDPLYLVIDDVQYQ
jgi:hypothetical protein